MKPDEIETVRVRMLRIYQRDRLLYRDIAKVIGYAPRTVAGFLRGEETCQSSILALACVKHYPEVGDGMIKTINGEMWVRV